MEDWLVTLTKWHNLDRPALHANVIADLASRLPKTIQKEKDEAMKITNL